MRELDIGMSHSTVVVCLDKPGQGGACHHYGIYAKISINGIDEHPYCSIKFQNGPIKNHGVNGCQNEDLLAIVIDRLRGFQTGKFSCRENAIALTKLEESLMWLNKRTRDRIKRGVEGKNIK